MNGQHGIEEIISTLYEMIQDAKKVPFSGDKCAVEQERALDLLDELLNQLPGELKQAKTIVESRSDVIASAQHEADNILRKAQQQAQQMISQETIMKEAEKRAAEYVQQTKERADEMKKNTQDEIDQMERSSKKQLDDLKAAAMQYLDNSLRDTEEQMTAALEQVRQTRKRFQSLPNTQQD